VLDGIISDSNRYHYGPGRKPCTRHNQAFMES
jgi:hypothetical protein